MAGAKNNRDEVEAGIKLIFPRLWRYCTGLTGRPDTAEDLVQNVCVRALEKSNLYTPGTHLDRWLFRIAQRIWFNEVRSAKTRRGSGIYSIEDVDVPDTKPNPEANIFASDVLKAIMGLPDAQRVTVILVYVEGLSYKDAASQLDIPIGTVMSRLAAARAKLSDQIHRPERGLE